MVSLFHYTVTSSKPESISCSHLCLLAFDVVHKLSPFMMLPSFPTKDIPWSIYSWPFSALDIFHTRRSEWFMGLVSQEKLTTCHSPCSLGSILSLPLFHTINLTVQWCHRNQVGKSTWFWRLIIRSTFSQK